MTETPSAEQFKEQVRQEWTDPATIAAWRKWHPKFVIQSSAATEAIVQAAQVKPGMRVLDLASGTGEPALALAKAVGSDGHVTATDLGPGMITIAEENAQEAGLVNMTFRQADAHSLPFSDRTFDRVTCRFGVMYFAAHGQALREIYRVLKPGGRVALAAWGPLEQNPYFLSALSPFLQHVKVPPPPPGAPQPFKFAQSGTLSMELRDAGFQQVQEEFRSIPWPWPGPPEELWQHFREVAVPFHPIIEGLAPEQLEQAIGEVVAANRRYYDGRQVNYPGVIVVASGMRYVD